MPDVLLIVTDDQHNRTIDWMDAVGRRIVERGTRYPNGMVPTSVCCPSRASLLTGLFAHSTGVWSNGRSDDIPHTGGWSVFHEAGLEDRTLAVWLQQAGYRTVLIGKYLNGYDGSPAGYVPPGWTTWHAFAEANGAYFDYRLRHSDGFETTHGDGPAAYSTDVLARIGVRTVREAPSYQPLFMMFTPYAVHGPMTPAPRHVGTATVGPFLGPSVNEPDVSDKPPWVAQLPTESIDRITQLRRNTQETLRSVDEGIAALLDAFKQHRDLDDTLVIFTSDYGHLWGEHRVSLLGSAEREGFALESPVTDGHDGSGQKVARPGYCGYRTHRFVYVRYSGGVEELYDYQEDPFELTNVAQDPGYAEQLIWMRSRPDEECSPQPPGYIE